MVRIVSVLPLFFLILSGCASAPPPAAETSPALRLYNTYGRALEAGALVYTESMLAAGEAHAKGVITDAQLAAIRNAGRNAEATLRLAKAGLQLYVAQQAGTADTEPGVALSTRFAAFNQSIADLTRLLVNAGVTE
jgi:hypothetical protein